MSESTPSNTIEAVDQFDTLYTQLLNGSIPPIAFLKAILELDQSDPERLSALRATEYLSKQDVIAYFSSEPEQSHFYNLRSFSFFHKAQIRLSRGDEDVFDDLAQSLSDAEKCTGEDTDWKKYVQATIAYLKNDTAEVRRIAETIQTNRGIVENFVAGLEKRGHPDYLADYNIPRT